MTARFSEQESRGDDEFDGKIPEQEMQLNLKIMDSIISKYKPNRKQQLQNVLGISQGSEEHDEKNDEKYNVGLERISKHLLNLSGGRLQGLEDIRAP